MERRNELLTEIARLVRKQEMTPLTDQEQSLLDELRAELRKIDQPPERVEDPRIPDSDDKENTEQEGVKGNEAKRTLQRR